jgi:hypothetical protein
LFEFLSCSFCVLGCFAIRSLKALKAGSTGALHTLGMLYNTEIFASFDPEVAFKYFTKVLLEVV